MYTYHLQPLEHNDLARTADVTVVAEDLVGALAAPRNGLRPGLTVAVYKELRPGALIPMGVHEVLAEDRP